MPKVFYLMRDEDVSGVSGTGKVAEGLVFTNGKVAIGWNKQIASITVYNNLNDAIAIHGHDGRTRFEFVDCLKDCE